MNTFIRFMLLLMLVVTLMTSSSIATAQSADGEDIEYSNDVLGFSLTLPATWEGRYIAWETPGGVSFLNAHSNELLGGSSGELFTIGRRNGVLTPEEVLEGSGLRLLAAQTDMFTYVLSGPSGVQYTDVSEAEYLEMRKDIDTILQTVKAIPIIDSADIQVIIDAKRLAFEVPPKIVNDRILVPLRAIFEEMGAEVLWNDQTRTVTAKKGYTVVVLSIGDISPTVNGEVVPLDQPGIIVDGRTLAPLRFVAEAFGGYVIWTDTEKTASILTSL